MDLANSTSTNILYEATVFLVDDEPMRSGFTERRLRNLKMRKETEETISGAKDRLSGVVNNEGSLGRPVIVVLDLMFPSDPNDGIDFLKELRAGLIGVPKNLPVIVHTATSDPIFKDLALRSGADDYIVKGTDPQRLDEALHRAAGRESLVASVLCEVVAIDTMKEIVKIRIHGENDWIAERELSLGFCPPEARMTGGTFFLETYSRRSTSKSEYILRSKSVNLEEEAAKLRELFDDAEEE